jgi:hypothetical protein
MVIAAADEFEHFVSDIESKRVVIQAKSFQNS